MKFIVPPINNFPIYAYYILEEHNMFFNCLILSISVTVDAMGIGITYGIKNAKLDFIGKLILFIICFITASMSILFGDFLKNVFTEKIATCIGTVLLVSMGVFIIYQGITIQIIKKTVISDLDNSNKITPKEAFLLALAVSADAFCAGLACGILGLGAIYYPFFAAIFHISFLQLGLFLGRKINKLANLPQNVWSLISGTLLILIGLSKLFFS